MAMRDQAVPFDLSIITVSWNVRDLLRDCLRSVDAGRNQLNLEMIVVDGASNDGSADMVQQEFPWVNLIVSEKNLGFPGGNNLGIAYAKGRNILLLNPTWLETIAPASILRSYYTLDLPDSEKADVDWLTGACLLVPRRVIDHVGLLDEEYFMYSEELDWCRRIKDAGWRVFYLPQARIIHHVGKSSEQAITDRHINFQRAKLRYFRKYHGRFAATSLRAFLLLIYSWQIIIEALKGLLGHKRTLRWQRVRSYWQVLRSGLKPAGY
jgi:GT2 family glycosyltransferase